MTPSTKKTITDLALQKLTKEQANRLSNVLSQISDTSLEELIKFINTDEKDYRLQGFKLFDVVGISADYIYSSGAKDYVRNNPLLPNRHLGIIVGFDVLSNYVQVVTLNARATEEAYRSNIPPSYLQIINLL